MEISITVLMYGSNFVVEFCGPCVEGLSDCVVVTVGPGSTVLFLLFHVFWFCF